MPDTETSAVERKRSFDTYDFTLLESEEITPHNKRLRFALPAGKSLVYKGGQYAQLFIPTAGGVRRRAYSIASPPFQRDCIELCVTLVAGGLSSTWLHALKPGDTVQGIAPLGHFTIQDESRDFVFIATGSGVAPFRAMIQDMTHRGLNRHMYLIYGHRYEKDILFRAEWEAMAVSNPYFHVLFTLSRDTAWAGERGYVQEKIEGFVPDIKEKNVYICGLNNMILGVKQKLFALGVEPARIHTERYD